MTEKELREQAQLLLGYPRPLITSTKVRAKELRFGQRWIGLRTW